MRKFLVGLAALTAMTTGFVFAADIGSKADIAAVQAAEHQIPPTHNIIAVHVVGNYALLLVQAGRSWSSNIPESYVAFKRISGERWTRIYPDNHGDQCTALVQHGVPASIAHQLCTGWGDVGS